MSDYNVVKKLSPGSINEIRGGFKNVKERMFVARIMGVAYRAEQKEDKKFGSVYFKFVGKFEATNMNGEIFAAPVCYLPEPVQTMLAHSVNEVENAAVKFAFDIFVNPRADVPIGYEYQVKPLVQPEENDELSDMRGSLPALAFNQDAELPLKIEPEEDSPKVQNLHKKSEGKKSK